MPEGPPPQQYASYPRGNTSYGSADNLQALANGYFGLNTVFFINIALVFAIRMAIAVVATQETYWSVVAGAAVVMAVVVATLTYPKNKRVGEGLGWQPSGAAIASILMGLNSALCCGVLGYIIVQSMAAKEMKKYGLQTKFFGLKKREVEQRIAELRRT